MPKQLMFQEHRMMTSALLTRVGGYVRVPDLGRAVVLYPLPDLYDMLMQGQVVQGYLEPGDGTRYDLALTPITAGAPSNPQFGLLVSRLISDRVLSSVVWDWCESPSEFAVQEAASVLSNGNAWTATLFVWWLTLLCEREG